MIPAFDFIKRLDVLDAPIVVDAEVGIAVTAIRALVEAEQVFDVAIQRDAVATFELLAKLRIDVIVANADVSFDKTKEVFEFDLPETVAIVARVIPEAFLVNLDRPPNRFLLRERFEVFQVVRRETADDASPMVIEVVLLTGGNVPVEIVVHTS